MHTMLQTERLWTDAEKLKIMLLIGTIQNHASIVELGLTLPGKDSGFQS